MRKALVLLRRGAQVYREEGLKYLLARTKRFFGLRLFGLRRKYAAKEFYQEWMVRNENYDSDKLRAEITHFTYKPLISIVTPVFNIDPVWLGKLLDSVMVQFYENWELILVDDGSTNAETKRFLGHCIPPDSRIKVVFGTRNEGISRASNKALELCSGEYVTFLDHDDELAVSALYEVLRLLNEDPKADIIYSDEDKITADQKGFRKRHDPFFKPDWDPFLLMGSMYVGHLAVYRRKLVERVGRFRPEFDFSQDYDLALRVTEVTDNIRHIAKVLYHWRTVPESGAAGGKSFARTSNIAALRSAVERRGLVANVVAERHCNRVRNRLEYSPLVSIIIPTDNHENIIDCLNCLFDNTAHAAFEVIIVTNSKLAEILTKTYGNNHKVRISLFDEPFNFSKKCNQGAEEAKGDFILFLNDDVQPMHSSWLEEMVEVFGHKDVGGVSPKMLYEDDSIQYAGMVTGVRGGVTTMFNRVPGDSSMYFNLVQTPRCVSVLSGACLLMKKELFFRIGGFDNVNTPTMDSDLDLSFKLLDLRYRLVYQPFACLRHLGHLSIGDIEHEDKHLQENRRTAMYMIKRWGHRLSRDDYFTTNMRHLLHEDSGIEYALFADRQRNEFLSAKNILIINHDLSLTGAPILTFHAACRLQEKGYFVVSASPSDGPCRSLYTDRNIPVMIEPNVLGKSPIHWQAAHFMRCFDAVVVSTVVPWRTVRALRNWSVPVIWLVHETVSMIKQIVRHDYRDVRKTFPLANDIVICGKSTAQGFDEAEIEGNFSVLPFAASPLSVSRNSNRRSDNFTILHVGSCERRKGQDVLIKSILSLPEKYLQNIKLKFAGAFTDGHYEKMLRTLARENDRVAFLGEITRGEIGNHYHDCDLFVCSSRDETGPLVVAEAMSLGKPIVSTRVGSVPEMIEHMESGILVDVDDIRSLSEAIMMMMDHPVERERLGRNAARRCHEQLSIDIFTEKFTDIVQRRLGVLM
jgi:O-antigen biosynthesis protein